MYRYDEEAFGLPKRVFQTALAREGVPCSVGEPLYRNEFFFAQPHSVPLS